MDASLSNGDSGVRAPWLCGRNLHKRTSENKLIIEERIII